MLFNAKNEIPIARPILMEFALNALINFSSLEKFVSLTLQAASATQEKTAPLAKMGILSRTVSASDGNNRIWDYWVGMIVTTSTSLLSMSGKASIISTTYLQLQQ